MELGGEAMNDETVTSDPAAVFGCALSLWQECMKTNQDAEHVNLSECYNGGDEFMRVVMRTATRFETWASRHVAFPELGEVWPYLMEDKFGPACIKAMGIENLAHFNDDDALRVALSLRLPIELCDGLPLPVDVSAVNPVQGSGFTTLRIQTMREFHADDDCLPFTADDEPFDEQCGPPYFALFGIGTDGFPEHIAHRTTYTEARRLVQLLAPGVDFPKRIVVNAAR